MAVRRYFLSRYRMKPLTIYPCVANAVYLRSPRRYTLRLPLCLGVPNEKTVCGLKRRECILAKKKQKYYVVWVGRRPGVYTNWEECQSQVAGFEGAKFKSFESRSEAESAYQESHRKHIQSSGPKTGGGGTRSATPQRTLEELWKMGVDRSAICVDAACSGNPGVLEYRGVTMDGTVLFHRGPFPEGTVNLGEFLAIVSALAMLHAKGDQRRRIYTDSRTAMAWVRNRRIKTSLARNEINADLMDRVQAAVQWLIDHTFENPITKWETDRWGEIPADFGRK